jgi:Flp pilus assembly protein TadG
MDVNGQNLAARRGEKGFTLIATAVGMVAILGIAGVSVDLGRMYITKSELAAYTDAASIAAAIQLDGTSAGVTRAINAATGMGAGPNAMGWDFGTKQITGTTIQFTKGMAALPNVPDPAIWSANPLNPVDYRFAQVTASAAVPLTFIQAFRILQGGSNAATSPVASTSISAQALITSFPAGLLPFSPIGPTNVPDDFGFTRGQEYTIRYPSGGGLNQNDVCTGDRDATYWQNLPADDHGFWGENSASAIRGEIINNEQTEVINIGDPVPMVGGNKNTEGDALDIRVQEDSDPFSPLYADYMALGNGNGRRIVAMPINNGPPNFVAVGIGAFFLRATPRYQLVQGNMPICAEYIGPYVQGSMRPGGGATGGAGNTGGYVVRLIQ